VVGAIALPNSLLRAALQPEGRVNWRLAAAAFALFGESSPETFVEANGGGRLEASGQVAAQDLPQLFDRLAFRHPFRRDLTITISNGVAFDVIGFKPEHEAFLIRSERFVFHSG